MKHSSEVLESSSPCTQVDYQQIRERVGLAV